MPTGEERRGAVCGKIACTVRCRRREETRPVGPAVRLRRLPPTLPRPADHRSLLVSDLIGEGGPVVGSAVAGRPSDQSRSRSSRCPQRRESISHGAGGQNPLSQVNAGQVVRCSARERCLVVIAVPSADSSDAFRWLRLGSVVTQPRPLVLRFGLRGPGGALTCWRARARLRDEGMRSERGTRL